ncbi:hypothetical protein [Geobacillus sp. FW23]
MHYSKTGTHIVPTVN